MNQILLMSLLNTRRKLEEWSFFSFNPKIPDLEGKRILRKMKSLSGNF